ncbi:MAG: acyl-CoA dehydrogenase family protein, partial [Bacteriovoracaceae bacterium]
MEFYQDPPQLGNQYTSDRLLRSYLERTLPQEILKNITPDLERFGAEVAGPILKLGENAETNLPVHVPYSPWGKRIDDIRVSPEWIELEKISSREGLVAIGYERKQKEFSRLYQFAKLYLFHPSSAVYTCPLAMTDGASRIIELYGSKELKDRAYKFLTSRDPNTFWTSGQWMTEKTGGSDVSGTSTVAKLENGTYRLYGQKWFTSATTSQMAVTLARLEGQEKLTLFYLELRDEKGNLQNIKINRLKDKLGTKALPTAELELTGTPALMVGEPGKGVKTIAGLLNITRLHNAFCAVGTMRRGLNLAIDYAGRRTAFGKKLIDHGLHVNTLAGLEVRFMAS